MAKDLFAPPTKEEIQAAFPAAHKEDNVFAPPTEEELRRHLSDTSDLNLQSQAMKADSSDLGAAALGAGNGASLGFGDELVGAVKGGFEAAQSGDLMGKFPEAYRKNRDEARQALKEAEKNHPKSYFLGDVVGNAVAPVPALTASRYAKLKPLLDQYKEIKAASQAAQEGVSAADAAISSANLAKTSPEAMAELKAKLEQAKVMAEQGKNLKDKAYLTKLATKGVLGGEAGALGGALANAGASEKENPTAAIKDAIDGAGAGMMLGGGLSVGGELGAGAIKGTGSAIGSTGIVKDAADAYKVRRQGGTLDLKTLESDMINKTAPEFVGDIDGLLSDAYKIRDQAMKEAQAKGIKLDISDVLKKVEEKAKALSPRLAESSTDRKALMKLIENDLYGSETNKIITTPSRTEVIPGNEVLPSGEDVATQKLQDKLAKLRAQKQLGAPEMTAEQRLKERYAKKALENPDEVNEGYSIDDMTKGDAADKSALLAPNPVSGSPMAQMIKDIKPGEIQSITDPDTGKKFMASVDEASGKVHLEPAENVGERMDVSFKTTPEKQSTIKTREGGNTLLSPEEVSKRIADFRQKTTLGDTSLKTPEAQQAANEAVQEMTSGLKQMGDEGATIAKQNAVISKLKTVEDILYPATQDLTTPQKLDLYKKVTGTVAKLDASTGMNARASVNTAMDALRAVSPELAAKWETKLQDKARVLELAQKAEKKPINPGTVEHSFYTLPSLAIEGAGGIGAGVARAGEFANNARAFINENTPDTLKTIASAVSKNGGAKALELSKKLSSSALMSPTLRKAMLFAIMQDPDYRRLLNMDGKENGQ